MKTALITGGLGFVGAHIAIDLLKNKKVKISNFGTFILKKKNKRIGRNPKTKEEKIISERNVILFKPSKELKNYINDEN